MAEDKDDTFALTKSNGLPGYPKLIKNGNGEQVLVDTPEKHKAELAKKKDKPWGAEK